MNISLTQLLIILNTCMFMQYDMISKYLSRYAIFSTSKIQYINDIPRLIVPHFAHLDLFHLIINMLSLSRTGKIMEDMLGSYYFLIVFLLGIFSSIFHILLSYLGIYLYNNYSLFYSNSLGFSCILFGLRYIYLNRLNTNINMFGFDMNSKYAIWYDLVLAQIFMPRASFYGHLSGILAGITVNELISL